MLQVKHIILFALVAFSSFTVVLAQDEDMREETVRVQITRVDETACPTGEGLGVCKNLHVLTLGGSVKGRFFTIEITPTSASLSETKSSYQAGEVYYASYVPASDSREEYLSLGEIDRTGGLLLLSALFILLVLVFARKQGFFALLALVLNFVILIFFFAKGVFWGLPVLLLALIGGVLILFFSLFLSHGFNPKTVAAFLGSLAGLALTILLSLVFIQLTRLTGFGSEEAAFLTGMWENVPIKDILFLGIMIGMLGVLDDITISQSAIAFQLSEANPKLKWREVYARTLSIGKDHVASLVNTLIVAYAGASFPLFLLLIRDSGTDVWSTLNSEMIAVEIVRMLVGSIGLIVTIPVTTWIASKMATRAQKVA